MSFKIKASLMAGAVLLGAAGLGLGACGERGVLEQPAPLFGERAKEDYAAKRAAVDAAHADAHTTGPTAAADQPDPDADNAPRTARDLQAPEQDNVPASHEPIPGTPDMMGSPPSMRPPGA